MTLVQIIKLVHTTATKFHTYTLVLAFKTLFYIYVHSKPSSNLFNASKTSITQIVHRLYRHFKVGGTAIAGPKLNSTSEGLLSTPPIAGAIKHQPLSEQPHVSTPDMTTNLTISLPTELQSPPPSMPIIPTVEVTNIIDDMIDKVMTKESIIPDPSTTTAAVTTTTTTTTIITTTTTTTAVAPTSTPADSPSTDNHSKVIHPTVSPAILSQDSEENDIVLRDSILVFRLLCELSLREIVDYDSPEIRIRIFSLELISTIFEEFGRYLKLYPNIVNYEIREGLFPSILNSGFSSNNTIFKLSLTLFLYLVVHFREFLKDDIGQYYGSVVLRVLESPTSSIQQRWMVLQVLSHVCDSAQILVDLYVNYDCSLGLKDLFQRTIEDLSRIAQLVVQDNRPYELKVKHYALDCLFRALKALDDGLNTKREGLAAALASLPRENAFTRSKDQKLKIEEGKHKFKLSPKRGVEFFLKIGAIPAKEAIQVAKFLRDTDGMDKVAVGIYLTEREDFNISVLTAYADLFTFTGYTLDGALRHFLSNFRLVGEAQKVDRVMETFAIKFFKDNCDIPGFECANKDATFILSFAIVMLATDLHNPAIKTHMTRTDWLKMNIGNNNKKNFDEQYLLGIYERISMEELKLREDDDVPSASGSEEVRAASGTSSFSLEDPTVAIVDTRDRYHTGVLLVHIRPMIGSVWHPILVALSLVLENSEESRVVATCLDGFRAAADLTALLGLSIEREAFVSSLANFTISDKLKELKQKNMEALEKLIQIARACGNYLEKSWHPVLKSISLLERLRGLCLGVNNPNPASGDGGASGAEFRTHIKRSSISSTADFFALKSSSRNNAIPLIAEGVTLEHIAKAIESGNHLYATSGSLAPEAIVHFVEALTAVSFEEIRAPTPATFSLLKLVEVAAYNTPRIRLLWPALSDHFTRVGTMPAAPGDTTGGTYIASLVIDSLKQLAQRFLDQEDSQKEFLRPLELIFSANTHPEVRELILKCIFQLTNGRNALIKSGWRPIFSIFTLSSRADHAIASQAFDFVDELIRDFTLITETFFIDYVNCLCAYANSAHKDLSLKAIDILHYCGVQLANGRVCTLAREEGASGSNTTLFTDSEQHISLWFPLLTGLARVISHEDPELRSYALDTLFRVLALFGSTFSAKLWELIFRGVLLPIFDNVGYSKGAADTVLDDTKWLLHTGDRAFKSLTEMFINFIDIICFLLDDMLDLFVSCILQDNEILAKTAGTFLIQLVTHNGSKFSDIQWSNVCQQFFRIFQSNTPFEIFSLPQPSPPLAAAPQQSSSGKDVIPADSTNVVQNKSSVNPQPQDMSKRTLPQHLSVKTFDKLPSSAPISPTFSPQQPNSGDGSNKTGHKDDFAMLRQSASLPTTPLSLTPPLGRSYSASPNFPSLLLKKVAAAGHARSNSNAQLNDVLKSIQSKCSVQLQMVQAINDIAFSHYEFLNTSQLLCLGDCLDISYHFCVGVLKDEKLAPIVSRIGTVLKILHQNTITGYLNLLIVLYTEQCIDVFTRTLHSEYRLVSLSKELIETYLKSSSGGGETIVQTDTILKILKGISTFNDEKFLRNMTGKWIYLLAVNVVTIILYFVAIQTIFIDIDPNTCTMTYMTPTYYQVPTNHTHYHLYLYRESATILPPKDNSQIQQDPPTVARLARPLRGAEAHIQINKETVNPFEVENPNKLKKKRKSALHDYHNELDIFTLDFEEELSAFGGDVIVTERLDVLKSVMHSHVPEILGFTEFRDQQKVLPLMKEQVKFDTSTLTDIAKKMSFESTTSISLLHRPTLSYGQQRLPSFRVTSSSSPPEAFYIHFKLTASLTQDFALTTSLPLGEFTVILYNENFDIAEEVSYKSFAYPPLPPLTKSLVESPATQLVLLANELKDYQSIFIAFPKSARKQKFVAVAQFYNSFDSQIDIPSPGIFGVVVQDKQTIDKSNSIPQPNHPVFLPLSYQYINRIMEEGKFVTNASVTKIKFHQSSVTSMVRINQLEGYDSHTIPKKHIELTSGNQQQSVPPQEYQQQQEQMSSKEFTVAVDQSQESNVGNNRGLKEIVTDGDLAKGPLKEKLERMIEVNNHVVNPGSGAEMGKLYVPLQNSIETEELTYELEDTFEEKYLHRPHLLLVLDPSIAYEVIFKYDIAGSIGSMDLLYYQQSIFLMYLFAGLIMAPNLIIWIKHLSFEWQIFDSYELSILVAIAHICLSRIELNLNNLIILRMMKMVELDFGKALI
eukprot:gene10888-12689_t